MCVNFANLKNNLMQSTSEVYTGLSRDSGERAPKRVKVQTSINKSEIVLTIGEVSVVGKGRMKIEFSKYVNIAFICLSYGKH